MREGHLSEEIAGPVIWQELMESQRTAERILHRLGFLSHAIVQSVISTYSPVLLLESDASTRNDVARGVAVVLSTSIDHSLPGSGLSATELFVFRRAIYAVAAKLAQFDEPTKTQLAELERAANGVGALLVQNVAKTAPARVSPQRSRVRSS